MEDLFDNGIDGSPMEEDWAWTEQDQLMEDQAEADRQAWEAGTVIYDDNGAKFTSCPAYKNYVIETEQYHIYWYPGSKSFLVQD